MSVADHTVSPIPREARPYQGLRAGVITRVAAAVLDTIVVAVVLGCTYAGVAGFRFLLNPRSFSFPSTSIIFGLTAAIVVATLYLAGGWALDGRTYGCHVLGLRVVSYRGNRMRPVGALVRALFCVFFPIGLCGAPPAGRTVPCRTSCSAPRSSTTGSPAHPGGMSRKRRWTATRATPRRTPPDRSAAEVGHLGAPHLEGKQVLALLGVVVVPRGPDSSDGRSELLVGGAGA